MDTGHNDSKQLGLAAVMFFGIMVQSFLRSNKENFSAEELVFIESYVQYGYITTISGIVTIILVTIYYFFPSMILYWVHMISIITTIVLLFIGAIGAISGNIILQNKKLPYNKIDGETSEVIMYFIPLYNIYLRYKEHNFTQSNLWLKESILLRSARSIIGILIQNQGLLITLFFIIIIRIVTIASGIDLTNEKIKKIIEKSFQVNPEECRAYIIATLDYISQQIQNKMIQPSRDELIVGYKKVYSHLQPVSSEIIIEYSIGTLCIIFLTINITNTFYTRVLYAPIIFIVGRYAIMYMKRKHLPHLPIAREINLTFQTIYTKIKNKIYPQ